MDVQTTSVGGIWWRQIPSGGDVFYRPPHPPDGRWQRGVVAETLYFADSAETAWAEWYRFLAEVGIPPNMALPRDLWQLELDMHGIADLSGRAQLAEVGLQPPKPGRHQWPHFQAVGDAIFTAGYRGLIAPSAARPEGLVLCLLREEDRITGVTPLPPPVEYREPPRVPRGMTT